MDLTELKLAPNAGMTPAGFVVDKMKYQIQHINPYTEAILQMFDSGRLTVRDVRLE